MANQDRSPEFNQIIGKPPPRLIRFGTTCVLFVVLILFLCSWIIKLPETIMLDMEIKTANLPYHMITDNKYHIKMLVPNGSKVGLGEPIAVKYRPNEDTVYAVKTGNLFYYSIPNEWEYPGLGDTLFSIMPEDIRLFGYVKIPEKYLQDVKGKDYVNIIFQDESMIDGYSGKYNIHLYRPTYINKGRFMMQIDLTPILNNWQNTDVFNTKINKEIEIIFSERRIIFGLFPILKKL